MRRRRLLIFFCVPFAVTGGVFALAVRDIAVLHFAAVVSSR